MQQRWIMKKLFSTLFFFCILAGIAIGLHTATLNRSDEGCVQLADFYKLDNDTVDVLFVGSSHVYYSINTCMLYDDYGIASYLLASPGQPVWISYYFLEEALKTQSPQLVVFDVCTLYKKESDIGAASWPSLISMKPSIEKWKAICAVNQKEHQLDSISAFFSFPYYHTRYTQPAEPEERYNGYKPDFSVIEKSELAEWENPDRTNFDKIEPVSAQTEHYLRKLIGLCRDKGIRLLLVNSPYLNQTEEKQTAYNYVFQVAQEYGVPFIDSNFVEELHINFAEDLLEPSHLNYYGSIKYTDYLAKWMEGHYELPDRRTDIRYKNWETASKKLRHTQLYGRMLKKLKKAGSFSEYMKAAKGLEECMVVTYQKPEGAVCVYDNGEMVFSGASGGDYFRHFDLGHSDLTVESRNRHVSVMVDRKEYSYTDEGMNVLVYDKVAEDVIDGTGFDADSVPYFFVTVRTSRHD